MIEIDSPHSKYPTLPEKKHEISENSNDTVTKKSSINNGLLMVPKKAERLHQMGTTFITKHKRAGSTGTTGDESCTTDEEDNPDEPDYATNNHTKLFANSFGSYSDIATITDKLGHLRVMHRNSSDSSVYSDLGLEKCSEEDLNRYDETSEYANREHDDSDCSKSAAGSDNVDWGGSVDNIKEQGFAKLQRELQEANKELKLKDEEVEKLIRIRHDVESELEDLTASLFQEAHNMVREANEKQAAAEKALKESQMKVDVLTAEVAALKTLVLTSTPSRPNPHLHPQIDRKEEGVAIFTRKHRRSPSHFNLKYGRENSPPESPVKEVLHISCEIESKDGLEVDPNVHKEFLDWKKKPDLDKTSPFIRRMYDEEINLCLCFNNADLSEKVTKAVENGTILIEAVSDRTKAMFPKKCALLEVPRLCFYRMNIGGSTDAWYSISQICRNRVIAVCDFLNYLKYIERGLVKSSSHDVYWEIVRLRKNMVLGRLGLTLT